MLKYNHVLEHIFISRGFLSAYEIVLDNKYYLYPLIKVVFPDDLIVSLPISFTALHIGGFAISQLQGSAAQLPIHI